MRQGQRAAAWTLALIGVWVLAGGCYLSHEPDAVALSPIACSPDEPVLRLTALAWFGDPSCPSVDLSGGGDITCALGAVRRLRIERAVDGGIALRFTVLAATPTARQAGFVMFDRDTCTCDHSGGVSSDRIFIGRQFAMVETVRTGVVVMELGALDPGVTYHVEACGYAIP